MYNAGKPNKVTHKRYILAVVLVLLFVGIFYGVKAIKHALSNDTVIVESPPITKKADIDQGTVKQYDEAKFLLSLPTSWKFIGHNKQPYDMYSWQAVSDKTSRRLDVYIDALPKHLAVNRMLPVQSAGNRISVVGEVSDNCQTFTSNSPNSVIRAKWKGVNFLCDLANYERDVTGTSSGEGINIVSVTGKATGSHKVFFAYTDNSVNPVYDVFYNVIQSFRVK